MLHGPLAALIYVWTAGVFGCAMAAGFAALVIVSLLTRPEDPAADRRSSSTTAALDRREGLPEGQPKPLAGERARNCCSWTPPAGSRRAAGTASSAAIARTCVGFVLAWGVVGLLVLAAWGLMQIGK